MPLLMRHLEAKSFPNGDVPVVSEFLVERVLVLGCAGGCKGEYGEGHEKSETKKDCGRGRERERGRYRCLGIFREETGCSLTLTIVAAAS
jgi:hypothetical protein